MRGGYVMLKIYSKGAPEVQKVFRLYLYELKFCEDNKGKECGDQSNSAIRSKPSFDADNASMGQHTKKTAAGGFLLEIKFALYTDSVFFNYMVCIK